MMIHRVDRCTECGLESLRELENIFRKCRLLTFIISCSEEVEVKKEDLTNICRILPCCGVSVHVQIGYIVYGYRNTV